MSEPSHADILMQLARLDERVAVVQRRQDDMARKLDALNDQASRWRGALLVVLGLGGVIGFAADWLARIWKV